MKIWMHFIVCGICVQSVQSVPSVQGEKVRDFLRICVQSVPSVQSEKVKKLDTLCPKWPLCPNWKSVYLIVLRICVQVALMSKLKKCGKWFEKLCPKWPLCPNWKSLKPLKSCVQSGPSVQSDLVILVFIVMWWFLCGLRFRAIRDK